MIWFIFELLLVTFECNSVVSETIPIERAYYFTVDDKIKTHESKNLFLDGHGRARMFHGVNAVTKKFPWYPEYLLIEEIQDDLESWGFNVVRLGTMWSGVEPHEGQYNQTYIDQLHKIVKGLAERGIYVILDMHQDAFSAFYDGFPSWLEDRYPKTNHTYPYPLARINVWEETYLTEEVSSKFQHFYDNYAGSTDRFGDFWQFIASEFGKYPSVLGYDILNEPWVGNYLEDAELLFPALAGSKHLMPLYVEVNSKIREVDKNSILFYEPVVFGQAEDNELYGSGFDAVPGGSNFKNTSAYSFHLYCWTLEMSPEDLNITAKDALVDLCNEYLFPEVMDSAVHTIDRTGGAAMLTQFGLCKTWEDTINVECESILDLCDDNLMSWIEWGFPMEWYDEKNIPLWKKINVFIRPYAQAVAGIPTFQKYNDNMKTYKLHYIVDKKIKEPTEIYIPPRKFEGGYAITVKPDVDYSFSDTVLYVFNKGVKDGGEVKITISRKPVENKKK